MNIDDYSLRLANDRKFLRSEYKKFTNSCYVIEGVVGTMHCDVLYSYLTAAKRKRNLRKMLGELLWYTDAQSISDENFKLILNFPSRYRRNYAFVLGHHSLAFYQMHTLNKYSQSYEVFAWLFDRICQYDCFTALDMQQILSENRSVTKFGIQQCIEHAGQKYGDSEKLRLAAAWVSKMK